jgi:hypothetical protein
MKPLLHQSGPAYDHLLSTLARVIENRHGTLVGIGSTLREALAEVGIVQERTSNSDGAGSWPPSPNDHPETYSSRVVGPWRRS